MTSKIMTPSRNHEFEGHDVVQLTSVVGTGDGSICLVEVVKTGKKTLVPYRHVVDQADVLVVGTTVFISDYDNDRTKGVIKTPPYQDRDGRVLYGVEFHDEFGIYDTGAISTY